jgi:hypothetical protein
MGLALYLVLWGLVLLGVGLIVYILLFVELTRRRHQRPLTAELLYLYLFGYGGIMGVLVPFLNVLQDTQQGPAQLFCAVTGLMAVTGGFIVLLWSRRRLPI